MTSSPRCKGASGADGGVVTRYPVPRGSRPHGVSDFGAGTLVLFEPDSDALRSFPLASSPSEVRQILGRPGEVWGAESAADSLVVVRGA